MQAKIKENSSPSRPIRIRSQIDIMASILKEAAEGAKKTRIMYRCNLSYRQLQAYLKLLLGLGHLKLVSEEKTSKPQFFKITAKGRAFLQAYRKLKSLMT